MQVEKAFLLALTLISSLPLACAPAPVETRAPIPAPAVLPLRVLRLYETGVGYFERSGAVAGDVATSLPVPAGHLDDALASLVVLRSGSGGQIAGLSFASSVTKATARSSAGLPPDPLTPITFQDLLESLKGARVAIQTHESPTPIEGRVVEVAMEVDEAQARVVAENRDGKREDPKRLVVTMLTARGELTLAFPPRASSAFVRPIPRSRPGSTPRSTPSERAAHRTLARSAFSETPADRSRSATSPRRPSGARAID